MMEDDADYNRLDDVACLIFEHQPDYLDGPWRKSTVALGERLGCTGFALNRLWQLTPYDWTCPCCQRRKEQIARRDKNGRLSGHIVYHHDHMGEYLTLQFQRLSVSVGVHVATSAGQEFSERVGPAIAAFDTVAVCQDCNNADSKAKKLVSAPLHFSFTSKDISDFVIATDNQPHAINPERVHAVWKLREPQLDQRLRIADGLASIAASNNQWHERAPIGYREGEIERQAASWLQMDQEMLSDVSIFDVVEAFRPAPMTSAPNKQWRRKRRVATQPPIATEIEHVKNVSFAGFWQRLPDDWTCPWCDRNKVQIMRPSGKSPWAFATHGREIYDQETGEREELTVCRDCEKVWQEVAKEAGSPSFAKWIKPEWIKRLLLPQPHAEHALVDDARIDEAVELLKQRAKKAEAAVAG